MRSNPSQPTLWTVAPVAAALLFSTVGPTGTDAPSSDQLTATSVTAWTSRCTGTAPAAPAAVSEDGGCVGVTVLATPRGVVVRHVGAVTNCCTTASVTATLDDTVVRFLEVERGEPCFCDCPSELGAEVRDLAPGLYTVEVVGTDGALVCRRDVRVGRPPRHLSFAVSGCRPTPDGEPPAPGAVEVAVRQSHLFLAHTGAAVPCSRDLGIVVDQSPEQIVIHEIDRSGSSSCRCNADIGIALIDLAPGPRFVRLSDIDGAPVARVTVAVAPPPTNETRPLRRRLRSFAPPSEVALEESAQVMPPAATFQVALSDLNGDTWPDAVLANMGDDDSEVRLNDGSGRLLSAGPPLTRQGHGVAVGDLDGDTDKDAFVVCAGYQPAPDAPMQMRPSVVYLNDGHGTLGASAQLFPDADRSGTAVFLLEADGDGDVDALVHYFFGPDALYLNDGTGTFSPAPTAPPESCAPVDLDADGLDDLFCTEPGIAFRVLRNDGDLRFTTAWTMAADPGRNLGLAAADFDGDGLVDVLAATGDPSNPSPAVLLVNDGHGGLVPSPQQLKPTTWSGVAAGDLNGDGATDVVITSFDGPTEIWLNAGHGLLVASSVFLPTATPSTGCGLADLDGDGRLDIVVSVLAPGISQVWFNRSPREAGSSVAAPVAAP